MIEPRRHLRALLAAFVVLPLIALCSACSPDDPSRARLDDLVRRQATRADVVSALGPGYAWYAQGTPEWQGLLDFLSREDASAYAPVRAAISCERRVMYYTSMWQQTWLFFNADDRIESYWTNTQ